MSAWPLCLRGAAVMIISEWRALRGDSSCACVNLCVYICIRAPLVRGSRVRLSDQHGDGACFVCQVINMFLPPALWGRWGCGGGSHSLLPLLTFPATPLSRNTLLLLFCVTRHYSVGFTTRWLSSETHKQTHAPTLDLVVRLLLCSTQHHLWMFYTH